MNSKEKKHRRIFRKQSHIHGAGIFAKRDFKYGQNVALIKGKIITHLVKDKKSSSFGPNFIGYGLNQWIDPKYPFSDINHSCNPNVGIKGKITVVAIKDIKKGDELLLDYSITESDKLWRLDGICKCGYKHCRKIIRSIQFLPKNIFNKYMPYIPNFFKKEYIKYNKQYEK